ncbi:MAG: 1-acyl-sn-glycerol-3-phosphate acyltransferase [Clostridia bacterium]|nr:1-acyl-sn-glycerol-3-phosphate acyltransferase [Clostridia bacterium]
MSGDGGHILHFPQPFSFEAGRDYDFLRRGALDTSWNNAFRRFAEVILAPYERAALGFRIDGSENIDVFDQGGAVVVCNHVNMLDCTFLEFAFPYKRTYFTTLESNFRIPVVRHLIRWLGAMPIPGSVSGMIGFKKAAVEAVRGGDCVIFYPESVLWPYYNGLRRFSPGAFEIACGAGVPVIPAVITFSGGKGIFALKRKPCVRMTVLPPLMPDGEGREAAGRLCDRCHAEMERAIAGINRKNGAPDDSFAYIKDGRLRHGGR